MRYYKGAYYLMRLRETNIGANTSTKLYTCSTCINDSYFDAWSIEWSVDGKDISKEIKSDFNLDEKKLINIHDWSNKKLAQKKIGWICTFADLETVTEYKQMFFPTSESHILGVYFPETEREEFLDSFEKTGYDKIGLSENLRKGIEESIGEQTLGYDLIGVEDNGEFHSFHCHDLAGDLVDKFGVEINEFGLIDENDHWKEMVKYMNDENNGFETSPWFYVKVTQVAY